MAARKRADYDLFGAPTETSIILEAAGQVPDADAQRAWVRLIERYRDPVQRCLEGKLRGRRDVDVDPGAFFTYLFELEVLPKYDRKKGSFRQYIQGVIARYTRGLRRAAQGSAQDIDAEIVPAPNRSTVEQAEEAIWAEAILSRSLERLAKGRSRDALILFKSFGIGGRAERPREDIAREFGLTTNAVNVALHRAKARLHDLILEEIREMSPDKEVFERERELMLARLLEVRAGLVDRGGSR